MAERVVAGSMAGAIAQSSIYPMEVRNLCTNDQCCMKDRQSWLNLILIFNRHMAIHLKFYLLTFIEEGVKHKKNLQH